MIGYNTSEFGPGNPVTRAQMVQILYNKAGRPAVTPPSRFEDILSNMWYEDAIKYLGTVH